MKLRMSVVAVAVGAALTLPAAAQVSLYSGDGFRGEVFRIDGTVWNLDRTGFNDRASSAVVERGRWEVCEDARFAGRCIVLAPGSYPSLDAFGFGNRISSVRPVAQHARYAVEAPPPPAPVYEYRRRPDERLFEATVTSVRAVVGPPEQRCWVERQDVVQDEPNVAGAILGGVIGGVLGHQVGAGRGRDVATVGGAVAGAAIGANAGRTVVGGRDVQRCAAVGDPGRPAYWDVTYVFRGVEHRAQMSAAPGPTVTVNGQGEPRA